MRPKVVILQETMPHYRVDFLLDVVRRASARGIDVDVLHGQAPGGRGQRLSTGRLPGATSIRNIYAPGPGENEAVVWQAALRRCLRADLVVVEQANRLLINYLLLVGQRARGPKVAFWGHGRNFQAAGGSITERFKARVAVLPWWWFAYTSAVAEYLVRCGFPLERITVVGNTIDVVALQDAIAEARSEGSFVAAPARCVYIGGLYARKRLDLLFDAADMIAQRVPAFELCIAGNGELRVQVERFVSTRSWAHYYGHVEQRQRAALLASARLLLVPRLVGLVALDSFAAGVPLVTMAGGSHGPEFEYLEDGVNAVLTTGESPEAYADAVTGLLRDDGAWEELRTGALDAAGQHALEDAAERMVDGLHAAVIEGSTEIQ